MGACKDPAEAEEEKETWACMAVNRHMLCYAPVLHMCSPEHT